MKDILVFIAMIAAVIFGVSSCVGGVQPHYSDGSSIGYITKFSHQGAVWKSWEGEMNKGGMASDGDGNLVPNAMHFNVQDPDVIKQIQEITSSKTPVRVKVDYQQWLVAPIKIDHDHVVTAVTILE